MTRKRRRLYAVLAGMTMLGAAAFLVLSAFNDKSRLLLIARPISRPNVPLERQLRIGGLVEEHSVARAADGKTITFQRHRWRQYRRVTIPAACPISSARGRVSSPKG